MGIKGLFTYLRTLSDPNLELEIHPRSTLVIDGIAFVAHILDCYGRICGAASHNLRNESSASAGTHRYNPAYFSFSYTEYDELIEREVSFLRDYYKFELVCFFDGSKRQMKSHTTEERTVKKNLNWNNIFAYCAAVRGDVSHQGNYSGTNTKDFPWPPQIMMQMRDTLHRLHVDLIFSDFEADQAMGIYCANLNARAREDATQPLRCFSYTSDTDLIIMRDSAVIEMGTLKYSPTSSDAAAAMQQLPRARVYRRSCICNPSGGRPSLLSFSSEDQLVELCILLGNDFSGHITPRNLLVDASGKDVADDGTGRKSKLEDTLPVVGKNHNGEYLIRVLAKWVAAQHDTLVALGVTGTIAGRKYIPVLQSRNKAVQQVIDYCRDFYELCQDATERYPVDPPSPYEAPMQLSPEEVAAVEPRLRELLPSITDSGITKIGTLATKLLAVGSLQNGANSEAATSPKKGKKDQSSQVNKYVRAYQQGKSHRSRFGPGLGAAVSASLADNFAVPGTLVQGREIECVVSLRHVTALLLMLRWISFDVTGSTNGVISGIPNEAGFTKYLGQGVDRCRRELLRSSVVDVGDENNGLALGQHTTTILAVPCLPCWEDTMVAGLYEQIVRAALQMDDLQVKNGRNAEMKHLSSQKYYFAALNLLDSDSDYAAIMYGFALEWARTGNGVASQKLNETPSAKPKKQSASAKKLEVASGVDDATSMLAELGIADKPAETPPKKQLPLSSKAKKAAAAASALRPSVLQTGKAKKGKGASSAAYGSTDAPVKQPSQREIDAAEAEAEAAANSNVLPIDKYEKEILHQIDNNRVTIIHGETGCGKSTRLPLMLYNHAKATNKPCKLMISQPRRIAAMALLNRLRPELGCKVGLRMGHDTKDEDPDTTVWFVTTGYLVRFLAHHPENFTSHTHLIVDEVHERSIDGDLLCYLSRKLLDMHPYIRIVLMSATIHMQLYKDYFRSYAQGPVDEEAEINCLSVGVRRFPVEFRYAADLTPELGRIPGMARCLSNLSSMVAARNGKGRGTRAYAACHDVSPDFFKNQCKVAAALVGSKHEELFGKAVVLFVSGYSDIEELSDVFMKQEEKMAAEATYGYAPPPVYKILSLHSDLPDEQQELVFAPVSAENYEIKIVIATNIAESSITLPDVDTVICFGTNKSLKYDEVSHSTMLIKSWISKDSATQRAGRTGRVRCGLVYRLYPKGLYDSFQEHGDSEFSRTPLQDTILSLRGILENSMDFCGVVPVLGSLPEPPDLGNVSRSLEFLHEGGLITSAEDSESQLTNLGTFCGQMGLGIHLSRIVFLGNVLGIVVESIIMAAALSLPKTPFRQAIPLIHKDPDEYNDIVRSIFVAQVKYDAGMYSEPLMLLNLYVDWVTNVAHLPPHHVRRWVESNGLVLNRMKQFESLVSSTARRAKSLLKLDTPSGEHLRYNGKRAAAATSNSDSKSDSECYLIRGFPIPYVPDASVSPADVGEATQLPADTESQSKTQGGVYRLTNSTVNKLRLILTWSSANDNLLRLTPMSKVPPTIAQFDDSSRANNVDVTANSKNTGKAKKKKDPEGQDGTIRSIVGLAVLSCDQAAGFDVAKSGGVVADEGVAAIEDDEEGGDSSAKTVVKKINNVLLTEGHFASLLGSKRFARANGPAPVEFDVVTSSRMLYAAKLSSARVAQTAAHVKFSTNGSDAPNLVFSALLPGLAADLLHIMDAMTLPKRNNLHVSTRGTLCGSACPLFWIAERVKAGAGGGAATKNPQQSNGPTTRSKAAKAAAENEAKPGNMRNVLIGMFDDEAAPSAWHTNLLQSIVQMVQFAQQQGALNSSLFRLGPDELFAHGKPMDSTATKDAKTKNGDSPKAGKGAFVFYVLVNIPKNVFKAIISVLHGSADHAAMHHAGQRGNGARLGYVTVGAEVKKDDSCSLDISVRPLPASLSFANSTRSAAVNDDNLFRLLQSTAFTHCGPACRSNPYLSSFFFLDSAPTTVNVQCLGGGDAELPSEEVGGAAGGQKMGRKAKRSLQREQGDNGGAESGSGLTGEQSILFTSANEAIVAGVGTAAAGITPLLQNDDCLGIRLIRAAMSGYREKHLLLPFDASRNDAYRAENDGNWCRESSGNGSSSSSSSSSSHDAPAIVPGSAEWIAARAAGASALSLMTPATLEKQPTVETQNDDLQGSGHPLVVKLDIALPKYDYCGNQYGPSVRIIAIPRHTPLATVSFKQQKRDNVACFAVAHSALLIGERKNVLVVGGVSLLPLGLPWLSAALACGKYQISDEELVEEGSAGASIPDEGELQTCLSDADELLDTLNANSKVSEGALAHIRKIGAQTVSRLVYLLSAIPLAHTSSSTNKHFGGKGGGKRGAHGRGNRANGNGHNQKVAESAAEQVSSRVVRLIDEIVFAEWI